jgi:predicted O-methyltransferase YrrM
MGVLILIIFKNLKKLKKIAGDERYQSLLIQELDSISMLNKESLRLLHYLGSKKLTVLEIGPYIGGSAIAIAKNGGRGRRNFPKPHDFLLVTIEMGGAYDHDQLPSANIIADLIQNLKKFGVEKRVEIIQGQSLDPKQIQACEKLLNGRKFDMVVIDSDGFVLENIEAYKRFFHKKVILVLDDYVAVGTQDWAKKAIGVNSWIMDNLENKKLTELLVLKWCTWFGIYRK